MSDSSRGSQRSADPRKDRNDAVHPAGMPERFDPLRTSFHRFWHPFRMRLSFRTIPVVSAMLRPPATLCHPCGMNRNDSNTPGDSLPPKIPHERKKRRRIFVSTFAHFASFCSRSELSVVRLRPVHSRGAIRICFGSVGTSRAGVMRREVASNSDRKSVV